MDGIFRGGDEAPSWNGMTTPKMIDRMEALYENSKWHDRVFKLYECEGGGEELVFAHSLILASSSPVFEALCFGPMAEENPISVPDVDPLAFRLMLKFIYTDDIEFTSVETACNILYASKKYLIYSLVGLAIAYISDHIDEINCLKIYEFAESVQECCLIKKSWNFICSHLDFVFKYLSGKSLSSDIVGSLVKEEALNGGELVIFKTCTLWAREKCREKNLEATGDNLRKLLIEMDFFYKIRWLTLTPEEFEDEPVKSGILTKEEIDYIRNSIYKRSKCDGKDEKKWNENDGDVQNAVQYPSRPIVDDYSCDKGYAPFGVSLDVVRPRRMIPLKRIYCHRFVEREKKCKMYLQESLKICTSVTSNKTIRLTGIFLNSKIFHNTSANQDFTRSYYVENLFVTICDGSSENVLFSVFFSKTVPYGTIFKIPIQTPIILERLQEYRIQVELCHSLQDYLFGVRNSVSLLPSGLCITFKEEPFVSACNGLVEASEMSVLSGLELNL